MRKGCGLLASVILLTALVIGGRADAIPTKHVECGDVIETSIRLANDLTDCLSFGLGVGRSGITIDLGGHRIVSDDPGQVNSAGIINGNDQNHSDVTIRNGVISGFQYGVRIFDSRGFTISGLTIIDPALAGIHLFQGAGQHTIRENVIVAGTGEGIELDSSRNVVTGNTFTGLPSEPNAGVHVNGDRNVVSNNRTVGGAVGISVSTGTKHEVTGNDVRAAYGNAGIQLSSGTDHVKVKGNTVIGNLSDGIFSNGSDDAKILDNVTTGNGKSGIEVSSAVDQTITGNTSSANSFDGLTIAGVTSSGAVEKNHFDENGDDGIGSESNLVRLDENTVFRNGFLNGTDDNDGAAITSVTGTQGSENLSSPSDDPNTCNPTSLCSNTSPPATLFTPLVATCGQQVSVSVSVLNNLSDCGDDGLEVLSNNVTIDMRGHRFHGTGLGTKDGIDITGRTSVNVRDGVLDFWDDGVHIENAPGSRADNMTIRRALGSGVDIDNSDNAQATTSSIAESGVAGVLVDGSTNTTIADNVLGVSGDGIQVSAASTAATIDRNTVLASGSDGIGIDNSFQMVVTGNTVLASTFSGIATYTFADDSVFSGNVLKGNTQNGVVLESTDDSTIKKNKATGNGTVGIGQDSSSTGNVIKRNSTSANGSDGIFSATSDVAISKNTANANGGSGIQSPAGTSGSDNTAKKNLTPPQCAPASLC